MSTTSDERSGLKARTSRPQRPERPGALALATALVAILLVPTAVAVSRLRARSEDTATRQGPPVATTTVPPTAGATRPATRDEAGTGARGDAGAPGPGFTTGTRPATSFPYQPLFPFASIEEAQAWQNDFGAGGHQPWHLDPEQTALAFVGYLAYSGVDVITSRSGDDVDAEVGVGYRIVEGRTGTAAIVHLVRFGSGRDAPWEVVGTADSDLTLTTPSYGATVSSPMTVGGRITGVDEAIHVQVRQLSSSQPLGESCCLPAGGERTPWQTTVSFRGARTGVLTVSASTGGHLQRVERFAVTGVRAPLSAG